MNQRIALQRLWWKELRQLIPMVTLMPLVVISVLVFWTLARGTRSRAEFISVAEVLCVGMPILFACGAGALLVGYEKEVRTLRWLSSLPIPSRRIVRVKLLAALVCLLGLWLAGLVMFAVFIGAGERLTMDDAFDQWPLFLNSLFILLAGFALAWWTRSALLALLLVVPVSIVPFSLAYMVDSWVLQAGNSPSSLTGTLLASQIIGIAVAWWFTERLGRQALAARSTIPARANWLPAAVRARIGTRQPAYAKIQPPISALLWQFAQQSRGVLWATSIMLAVGTGVLATVSVRSGQGSILIAALLVFLATTWLGVTTFQSDALGGRIRFLSDRGISPRVIWITRQALPVSLLSLFAVLAAVLCILLTRADWQDLDEAGLAIAVFSVSAVLVYLTSQWLAQVIFSPIVSAVAAPLLGIGALLYGAFSLEMLAPPWWLALLVLLIPAIATLTMTRRWMDGRLGFSYWASHAGFFAAACLLPAVPLLVAIAGQPSMPATTAHELEQAVRVPRVTWDETEELVISDDELRDRPGDPVHARWDRAFDSVEEQLQATNRPLGTSSKRVLEFLRTTAMLLRMSLDSMPPDSPDLLSPADTPRRTEEQVRQQYRRAIGLLVESTQRLRLSPELIDQDMADLLEIWLLAELRREAAKSDLGEPLYNATASMLADRDARTEARRHAVAVSWHRYWDAGEEHVNVSLGGYSLPMVYEDLGTLKQHFVGRRRVGMAVADLWELAQGGSEAATPERLRRIAEFWDRSPRRYGLGPHGSHLRADDLDKFIHPPFDGAHSVASQWSADWERLAAELSPE